MQLSVGTEVCWNNVAKNKEGLDKRGRWQTKANLDLWGLPQSGQGTLFWMGLRVKESEDTQVSDLGY